MNIAFDVVKALVVAIDAVVIEEWNNIMNYFLVVLVNQVLVKLMTFIDFETFLGHRHNTCHYMNKKKNVFPIFILVVSTWD